MNKLLNGLGVFSSIVFTVVLTLLIILLCLLLNVKTYFNEVNVGRILSDTDISHVLYLTDNNLYDNLTSLLETNDIDESIIESVLNGDKLKQTMSSYIASIYNAVINDEEVIEIEKEELLAIVEEAIDTVNYETDNSISNTTKGSILDIVDSQSDEILEMLPTEEEIKNIVSEQEEIEIIKRILNPKTITVLIFIIMLVLVIISLLRFSLYKWIPYFASSLLISSICFISVFIASKVIDYTIKLDNELLTYIVNIMINNLSSNLFITGIVLLLISIFVFIIFNNIKNTNKKKLEQVN